MSKERESIRLTFYKLSKQLFDPHESIQEPRKRQRARLFSIVALSGLPIFLTLHLVYSLVSYDNPIFLIGMILALVMYVISRSSYVDIAIITSVTAFAIIPTIFYFLVLEWSPNDPPELMLWITVSLLLSSFFIKPRYVILQYFVMVSLLLILSLGIFNIEPTHIVEEISVTSIMLLLIVMSSFMLEHYITKVIEKNAELDRRRWELEVYTKLLRHDLRNDMQSIVAAVGLSQMALDKRIDVAQENLETSLSVAESVVRLLDAFSVPKDNGSQDFVSMIERIAAAAQETHSGLSITIKASDEARQSRTTASRLMPLVWSNIFRNAAQYAGPNPVVIVDIQQRKDVLHITVSDNGPGISLSEKEWLFIRGKGDESREGGIGLYLVRIILESHGGSIELEDAPDLQGCTFQIIIPTRFSPT